MLMSHCAGKQAYLHFCPFTLAKPHHTFEQYSIIPTVVGRTTCITDVGTIFFKLLFRDCFFGTTFPGLLFPGLLFWTTFSVLSPVNQPKQSIMNSDVSSFMG